METTDPIIEEKKVVADKTAKEIIADYLKEKTAAMKARQVRVANWSQNDQLYSGQPTINLLTRSNLHVPKVFEGVQTMSSRIGQLPDVDYDTKPEGDENAPEIMRALFKEDVEDCGFDDLYEASKIEAGLYGRAVYKIVPSNSGARFELVDTMAFLINPTAKTHKDALYTGQQFIYKTLTQIEQEAKERVYDEDVIKMLKEKKVANETPEANSMEKSLRDLRLAYLGYANVSQLGADMVELTEWYTWIKDKDGKGKQYVLTVANDSYLLRCITLKEAGLNCYPFEGWATFPRGVVFWTPSTADVLRDPNLAMDVALNQQIDNNTYRNFGMLFVSAQSGLKQSAIVPRPLGVTPINVAPNSNVKDSVWQFTPPDISSATQTFMTLNSVAENAVGLSGTSPGQKGKMTVTQQAASSALVEAKTNLMRRNALNAVKRLADMYADIISTNLTEPRRVKVYGHSPTTIDTVTRDNFKDVEFMAKATPAELTQDNKAIEQKAAVELYTLFKGDPLIPGQKYLRERVAKRFDMSATDIGNLFTASHEDQALQQQMQDAAKQQQKTAGGGDIPANPDQPALSSGATATAANVPPAIR